MRLQGRLVAVPDVSATERDAMFALMDRHYVGVRREKFDADLDEKHWVIQLWDSRTETLRGFSTQRLLHQTVAGQPVLALFSGDTIVAREHWGDNALAHVWGRLALRLIDRHPNVPLYWFLLSKGYKTYRYLPLFFYQYYPCVDRHLPWPAKVVLDALASSHYPGCYDPATGVVHGDAGKDRLRPDVAPITEGRLQDRHVRFFVQRNPGHAVTSCAAWHR